MAKKYIDADRLKAEIEKHIKGVKEAEERFTQNMGFFDAKISGVYDVMAIIDSLQQEQLCDMAIDLDVIFSNMKRNEAIKQLEHLNKVYGEQNT